MATSAPDPATNPAPDPRPSGDLEYLFRQQLGEAAVPPRPELWEQVDHELLVAQNETYRRRLALHRWVAAACVLLVLGLGGWASLRQLSPAQPVATGPPRTLPGLAWVAQAPGRYAPRPAPTATRSAAP